MQKKRCRRNGAKNAFFYLLFTYSFRGRELNVVLCLEGRRGKPLSPQEAASSSSLQHFLRLIIFWGVWRWSLLLVFIGRREVALLFQARQAKRPDHHFSKAFSFFAFVVCVSPRVPTPSNPVSGCAQKMQNLRKEQTDIHPFI